MLGKDIANNLRNSKERWCKNSLVRKEVDGSVAYCILGLKAHEAGIPDELLDFSWLPCKVASVQRALSTRLWHKHGLNDCYSEVYLKNDTAASKESLIGEFDSRKWRDYDFKAIEALIAYFKDMMIELPLLEADKQDAL